MKSKCYDTKITKPKYIILQRMSERFFLWESYLQTNILRWQKLYKSIDIFEILGTEKKKITLFMHFTIYS